ncbi:MAG: DUF1848 domain-containing protein [bacterium]|nr:DUF1848 domain-containing protein [bacterium]
MIINVSERCDIVAFYPRWFMNRLKAGYVDVRNPFYEHQVSRIILSKETIDLIVFITKNPIPILKYLEDIPYPFLFQVTITPYRKNIEPYVASKRKVIEAVQQISKKIGKERMIIRYDPIFISKEYDLGYHYQMFEKLCSQIAPYTKRIIISFLDIKKNTIKHSHDIKQIPFSKELIEELAQKFSQIAKKYQLEISTCGENINLTKFNISSKSCLDRQEIETIIGKRIEIKERKSRMFCHCLKSVDIGSYNCCPHFCKYCYANYQEERVLENIKTHNSNSSLLLGRITQRDEIKIRSK